jgi:beta-lactamase regulating signal transducer with metallopeptidase domain
MNALEMWLVSYLANALWIVPLIFAAAWAAARLAQRLGPGPAHRIWVFALVTEALLPAMQLHLFNIEILRLFGLSGISSPVHSRTAITFSAFAGGHERKLILSHDALAAIATVYIAGLTYFATRLAYSLWKTHRIAMRADERCEERVADRWRTVAAFLSVDAGIAESAEIPGPVTVGVRRKLLLLPRGFASHTAEDLDAVMAHECAHMARHDFLKNLLYSLVSLPGLGCRRVARWSAMPSPQRCSTVRKPTHDRCCVWRPRCWNALRSTSTPSESSMPTILRGELCA